MTSVNDFSLHLYYGDEKISNQSNHRRDSVEKKQANEILKPMKRYDRLLEHKSNQLKRQAAAATLRRKQTQSVPVATSDDVTLNIQAGEHIEDETSNSNANETTMIPVSKQYIHPPPLTSLPKLKARTFTPLSAEAKRLTVSQMNASGLFVGKEGFGQLPLAERLIRAVEEKLHLTTPTRIQSIAIPKILEGKDILMKSETGTGKTLAYLLPLLHSLHTLSLTTQLTRASGPLVLILLPTRELALQVYDTLSHLLLSYAWIVGGILMGGENKTKEKSRIRKGINIVIATPGRLLDHLQNTSALSMARLKYLVLDEADRLLDMGFEKDIQEIISILNSAGGIETTTAAIETRAKRQTILVSATLQDNITKLASFTLSNPLHIGFDTAIPSASSKLVEKGKIESAAHSSDISSSYSLPSSLSHYYLPVESRHRLVALAAFLRHQLLLAGQEKKRCKVVVFFSTCASVRFHYQLFALTHWPPNAYHKKNEADEDQEKDPIETEPLPLLPSPLWQLHGDLPQKTRTHTYHQFVSSADGILLCTDVAARGLDLPAVDWIVQIDAGEEMEDYLHRVGRSARIGKVGSAVIFLAESEKEYITALQQSLPIQLEPLTLSTILTSLRKSFPSPSLPSSPSLEFTSPPGALLQRHFDSITAGQPSLHALAVSAYQSYLRAYAGYPKQLKKIFHPKRLHLGHVCRAFGLKEGPKEVGKMEGVKKKEKKIEKLQTRNRKVNSSQTLHLAEAVPEEFYDAGSDDGSRVRKKRKNREAKNGEISSQSADGFRAEKLQRFAVDVMAEFVA